MKWYDVPGHEQYLQINDNYEIWSKPRVATWFSVPRIIPPLKYSIRHDKKGYPYIIYKVNHHQYAKRIHRAVAEVFIPNPNNLPEVNHIDGNKDNWHPSNLEWVSTHDNLVHSVRTGLKKCNINEELYNKIKSEVVIGDRTFGIRPLSRKYNISVTTVRAIAYGHSIFDLKSKYN